jgi:hypothetical protein
MLGRGRVLPTVVKQQSRRSPRLILRKGKERLAAQALAHRVCRLQPQAGFKCKSREKLVLYFMFHD